MIDTLSRPRPRQVVRPEVLITTPDLLTGWSDISGSRPLTCLLWALSQVRGSVLRETTRTLRERER